MQDPSRACPDLRCCWMCCDHTPANEPLWTFQARTRSHRCGEPLPSPFVCKRWRHCKTLRGPETISPQSFLHMFVQVTLECTMSAHVYGSSQAHRDGKLKQQRAGERARRPVPSAHWARTRHQTHFRGWTPAWFTQHLVPFNPFQHGCVPATFITTVIWLSQKLLTVFWAIKWMKNATIAAAGCDLVRWMCCVTYRLIVSLALREGRENLFILMMTQTVVCWESTSTVSISLCAGAASWPRPRPWPPDTVSIDYCDSTRGAKTPPEADVGTTGATSAEANSRLQLLHGACFLSHEVSTNKRADSQSVLCLTGRKQERFALKWLMLSSLVVSMMVISPVRL